MPSTVSLNIAFDCSIALEMPTSIRQLDAQMDDLRSVLQRLNDHANKVADVMANIDRKLSDGAEMRDVFVSNGIIDDDTGDAHGDKRAD